MISAAEQKWSFGAMPVSVVAKQELDGTGQTCEYVDESQNSVEWCVEE
jgi:hypothetical protein